MGYYTDYTLVAHSGLESLDASALDLLEKEIEEMNVFERGGDLDFGYYANSKWYEHDEDMLKLSMRFPGVVFCLHGEGESSDDLWDAYYKDGRMQYCPAEITYGEFDMDALQYPNKNIDLSEKYSYQS